MKRNNFLKSLVGIALAPMAATHIVANIGSNLPKTIVATRNYYKMNQDTWSKYGYKTQKLETSFGNIYFIRHPLTPQKSYIPGVQIDG